jgi:hypothetical protein
MLEQSQQRKTRCALFIWRVGHLSSDDGLSSVAALSCVSKRALDDVVVGGLREACYSLA